MAGKKRSDRQTEQIPQTEPEFRRWAMAAINSLWREIRGEYDGCRSRAKEQREFLLGYFGFEMMPGPTIECRVDRLKRLVNFQRLPHELQ